jgi:hypothetical protein
VSATDRKVSSASLSRDVPPPPLSFVQSSLKRRDEKKKFIHLGTRIMKTLVFKGDLELGV